MKSIIFKTKWAKNPWIIKGNLVDTKFWALKGICGWSKPQIVNPQIARAACTSTKKLSVRVSGKDKKLSVQIYVEYGPAVVYLSIIQTANF